jgi:hypothetical protein
VDLSVQVEKSAQAARPPGENPEQGKGEHQPGHTAVPLITVGLRTMANAMTRPRMKNQTRVTTVVPIVP